MRLWSLHPKYLDQKGLVALWREGLLAKKVLQGETKGYKNHPQLDRFKDLKNPVAGILAYLQHVWSEASLRGYNFDNSKLNGWQPLDFQIVVTEAQLEFERGHLLKKLKKRDQAAYQNLLNARERFFPYTIKANPLFYVIEGGEIATWEKQLDK